jgi:murein DD-endopeptidase MepM/ murein hydrolase activator NlpD
MSPTRNRRLFTAIVIFLALNLFLPSAYPTTLSEKRKELQQIERRLKETRQKLEQSKDRQRLLIEQIEEIDKRIVAIQKEVERLEGELAETVRKREETEKELAILQKRLIQTRRELEKAKRELAKQNQVLNERLVGVYKNGSIFYIQVLLTSTDFADFLNRLAFLQLIVEQDIKLLRKIERTKKLVEERKAALEENQRRVTEKRLLLLTQERRIKALKQEQENQKAAAQLEVARQEKLLAEAKKEQETYENVEDLLISASIEVASEIRRLEREARSKRLPSGRRVLATPTQSYRVSRSGFVWPTEGRITSRYGMRWHPILGGYRMHTGVDIAAVAGQPIIAAQSGTVLVAGWVRGYGLTVIINHGNGVSTLYAHTSAVLVSVGDYVERGAVIAKVGSTGLATGPHLHFEVRVNGEPRDPMNWY